MKNKRRSTFDSSLQEIKLVSQKTSGTDPENKTTVSEQRRSTVID